jgi:hypothetical protein
MGRVVNLAQRVSVKRFAVLPGSYRTEAKGRGDYTDSRSELRCEPISHAICGMCWTVGLWKIGKSAQLGMGNPIRCCSRLLP